MSRVKLKICGMRDPQNIREVARLRPDYMGFIFYSMSKRYVGIDFTLDHSVLGQIAKVGVFVNTDIQSIKQNIHAFGLDLVQLHGDETPMICEELHSQGISIVKAFGIDEGFDFNSLKEFKPFVKHFLFDTKVKGYGGSGQAFDWKLLDKYDQEIGFFLSGGLGVEEILRLKSTNFNGWNIHAMDVNSKFESEPGLKDVARLEELIEKL